MNFLRIVLISVAAVGAASCSEKSSLDRSKRGENEEEKPRQEFTERKEASGSSDSSASSQDPDQARAETDAEPDAYQIGEDCVAFLRATKTNPNRGNGDCPQCPVSEATHEVLKFDHMQVDRISPSGPTCEVLVKILATFNPSTGEAIGGGLAGWISPEQRMAYSRRETPSGQQVYKVNITYRRTEKGWRAVEFN